MQVAVVSFRREEKSPREVGVAISHVDNCGGEVDVIVDAEGKVVPTPVWSYKAMEYAGCFTFNPQKA